MIDLRSDTVTTPTSAMRRAMADAEVGDDGYRDDPTVLALEAAAAERLGKAAALYVPSGTMSNLIAAIVLGTPGGRLVAHKDSHIVLSERGGAFSVAGLEPDLWSGVSPVPTVDDVGVGFGKGPALAVVELTHNALGGRAAPPEAVAAYGRACAAAGVPLHIDGARIFNAAVATDTTVEALAETAVTVTFCLSKGLGAPIGSVLCGPVEVIEEARERRKMLGGGMRQAGVIAAAGLVALSTMVDRLGDDHENARLFASHIAAEHPEVIDPAVVETNIVRLNVAPSGMPPAAWVAALARLGVRTKVHGTHVRAVFHHQVSRADAVQAAAVVCTVARNFSTATRPARGAA
ncbi:GntG family PLP-dependent aldolase [Acuticoccus mangrovi]|uniref:Low-specificity L-threonine aldolase n=1 Tax=Acuticoccus mangrovi TaxID=2796142 RepID=A0A934MJ43_9HYPH|nr:GntG family PLP-dependent aldolase [Acuticoccus mangrovi]MBJ3778525.1 low-specificity L-threonine aldolase [Acuticoccus mangrovi]